MFIRPVGTEGLFSSERKGMTENVIRTGILNETDYFTLIFIESMKTLL